jgi:rhodanese-related sulfurtransferase
MSDSANTQVPEVSTDELRTALDQGEPAYVLDVRPREEYEAWHVRSSSVLTSGACVFAESDITVIGD